MKIVFAGTPEFAAIALSAIVDAAAGAGWVVPLVLTQPDRPSGRGMKLAPSAVKQVAVARGIEVASPASLRHGDDAGAALAQLRAADPDVLIVAAYGLILPQHVLDIPRGLRGPWQPKLSAINIHASLLPRWRGAAPVVRAIEAGDSSTGITIMQMDAGLDTGPMLAAEKIAIASTDTARTLTSRLAQLGARMIVEALHGVDQLVAVPQPSGATYADKVRKSEAWLDWSAPAVVLQRKVRAFDPFPIAAGKLNGLTVKIWRAQPIDVSQQTGAPGLVCSADASGVRVACGTGELLLTELQRPGGNRLPPHAFLAGFPIKAGDRFATQPVD